MNKITSTAKSKYLTIYASIFLGISIVSIFINGCSSQKQVAQKGNVENPQKLLLRDEGLSQLSYVNLANSQENWYQPIPPGRDIQLVGGGRVLIGTGTGYEEREIASGKKIFESIKFNGTLAARRLRNGNTLLVGLNWHGKQGIVLVEVDKKDSIQKLVVYPGFSYVRLVRETVSGTFLVTADDSIFEGNSEGTILWQVKIAGHEKPHVWQALRLANGETIASTGFAADFQIFGKDTKLLDTIGGPPNVNPHFFSGFQILANGDLVVTNWQGHGPKFGGSGIQLLQYNRAGNLVWSWKQDSTRFSSLQGVIVLDGLDLNRLHIEDGDGKLAPVKTP